MAIIKKYNPKQIYLPERLRKKLDSIYDYSMTVVEAPAGYGKTTFLSEYLSYTDKKHIWFNIDNCNREQFFDDFCAKVESLNADIATKMRKVGYPTDEHSSGQIANLIMQIEFNKKTVLILDNYEYIADEYINNVLKDVAGKKDFNLIIVLLTRTISYNESFDVLSNNKVNYIGKSDLMLEKKEIDEYFKLCGMKLEDNELDYLSECTEGWISALYVQLHNFADNGTFAYNIGLNNLVYKTIWRNLSVKEQELLIVVGMFECFSMRQAIAMSNNITEQEINELLEKNGFIEYRPVERRYYIHYIFKFFLRSLNSCVV